MNGGMCNEDSRKMHVGVGNEHSSIDFSIGLDQANALHRNPLPMTDRGRRRELARCKFRRTGREQPKYRNSTNPKSDDQLALQILENCNA